MQLPRKEKREIIFGILPLLAEAFETTDAIVKVPGRKLIYEGVTKDVNGKLIHTGTEYVVNRQVKVRVNHARNILYIMDRSKTYANMLEDVSRYLAKHGKSKQAISDSIDGRHTES